MKTIILTGGGTAGHCTPHFAIVNELKKYYDKIIYIGSKNGIEKRLVKEQNLPYFEIDTVKLIRGFTFKNLVLPFKYINSVNQAQKLLEKLKPDVIFSKGGYVGLPVCHAGNKLKIPVIVHESDLTIGLSNKLSSKFANKVLTSFKETANSIKKGVYVGSPIREELFVKSGNCPYNLDKNKPTLLITGGSTGAKAINQIIYTCLNDLLLNFNVIHLVGKNNLKNIDKKGYVELEFANMQNVYPYVDICISRCGSNTAFELLSLQIPTLFIPLPKSVSRGDQIQNATYFKNKNLCEVIFQENLNKENLIKTVEKLYKNKNFYKEKMQSLNLVNANKKIIEILTKY